VRRGTARHLLGVLTALAAVGCEDPPHAARTLVVTSAVPDDGARNVPVSVVPRLVFDVPLDPNTVGPDAFRLWSGELEPGGRVAYSVVDRSLTFTPGVNLRARLAYAARLAPNVRGLDGSTPDAPVENVFVTGSDDRGRPAAPPDPTFARDVLPLAAARCASCHGGARPAAGLGLASASDLLATAVRSSAQWPTWPLVAVGSPERSYLLYKVTGAPGLVGQRMPPDAPLARDEQWTLERWIALGARGDPEP
jgi:hypothetical protein